MRYKPQMQDLDTKLKPFIPDYIPAVGDIDAMLKIHRSDGVDAGLGLEVLDEPCAAQSDATVLDLQLRSISKTTSSRAVHVKQLPNATKNAKAIDQWVSSIVELHRDKPPQSVQYSSSMPDIDHLMQEWPPEFEERLKELKLPGANLDVELNQYVRIICGLLDIPVHKDKLTESLHLLFTLFVEFKNSQHFTGNDEDGEPDATDTDGAGGHNVMTFD